LVAPDANPEFEVATIKPSELGRPGKAILLKGRHLLIGNYDVNDLILFAFGLHFKQIVGAPDWFSSALYDIDGVADVEGQPSLKQEKIMVQKLLTDRFKLVFHHDMKELSVYAITVEKGGSKLASTAPDQARRPRSSIRLFCIIEVWDSRKAAYGDRGTGRSAELVEQSGVVRHSNLGLCSGLCNVPAWRIHGFNS
jgi:hypothetical protein